MYFSTFKGQKGEVVQLSRLYYSPDSWRGPKWIQEMGRSNRQWLRLLASHATQTLYHLLRMRRRQPVGKYDGAQDPPSYLPLVSPSISSLGWNTNALIQSGENGRFFGASVDRLILAKSEELKKRWTQRVVCRIHREWKDKIILRIWVGSH